MTLSTSVKLFMHQADLPLADHVRLVASCGFDGIEVLTHSDEDAATLDAAARAAGVRVPTVISQATFFSSPTSPSESAREAATEGLLDSVRTAQIVGAAVVMISPGAARDDLREEDAIELSYQSLRAGVTRARENGIVVAIENLWNGWLYSPADLARYADGLGVKVAFDVGNAARFGAPHHALRALGDRVVRVDLKDYRRSWFAQPARVYGDDASLREAWGPDGPWGALDALPFDGDVDWIALAAAMEEVGYDGWICAEHGPGGLEFLSDLASRMRRFATLKSDHEQRRIVRPSSREE
jgi:hexulose-6-phosphate isomerase